MDKVITDGKKIVIPNCDVYLFMEGLKLIDRKMSSSWFKWLW